jgi:NAD(P)-dependent dehydrogenase (short-subunit alcohol dehydrogenase family)
MTGQLKDQVAIITGAGEGLGRTFAIHLADQGVRVVVNNRKREPEGTAGSADLTVAAIQGRGGTAMANYDPVDDSNSGERMVEQALEAFGRLDIVVPNAAISPERSVHRMPPDHFREVMDINFFGGLYLTHAAIPYLRAQGYGRLVFIISTAGLHGGHGLAAYSASKAALVALMQCVAVENREKGIRSNALAPYAATRMTTHAMPAPLRELLTPDRVAPLLGWLASPECGLSGEIVISGGGAVRLAGMTESGCRIIPDVRTKTAEDLEALCSNLLDMSDLHRFPDAMSEFEDMVRCLEESGDTGL